MSESYLEAQEQINRETKQLNKTYEELTVKKQRFTFTEMKERFSK